MNIYLYKDGQQLGPFTESEARAHLSSGSVSETDLAWVEGNSDWQPLSTILPHVTLPQPIAPAPIPTAPVTPPQPIVPAPAPTVVQVVAPRPLSHWGVSLQLGPARTLLHRLTSPGSRIWRMARSRPDSPNHVRAWDYRDFARRNSSGCVDSSRKSDRGSGFRVHCADSDDRSGIGRPVGAFMQGRKRLPRGRRCRVMEVTP